MPNVYSDFKSVITEIWFYKLNLMFVIDNSRFICNKMQIVRLNAIKNVNHQIIIILNYSRQLKANFQISICQVERMCKEKSIIE